MQGVPHKGPQPSPSLHVKHFLRALKLTLPHDVMDSHSATPLLCSLLLCDTVYRSQQIGLSTVTVLYGDSLKDSLSLNSIHTQMTLQQQK
jgi:hypothetical protein